MWPDSEARNPVPAGVKARPVSRSRVIPPHASGAWNVWVANVSPKNPQVATLLGATITGAARSNQGSW
jgi:hypothetical protein